MLSAKASVCAEADVEEGGADDEDDGWDLEGVRIEANTGLESLSAISWLTSYFSPSFFFARPATSGVDAFWAGNWRVRKAFVCPLPIVEGRYLRIQRCLMGLDICASFSASLGCSSLEAVPSSIEGEMDVDGFELFLIEVDFDAIGGA
ncbi:hypothetical protein SUGI_0017170 [Cryptomeria japonica]|nr:hypothetical protein SUGI_0017170 [Cryptomeria japonica]